jgi:outer membrane protein assembly factor BamE (lipoprotein component of BamABCDE complex)
MVRINTRLANAVSAAFLILAVACTPIIRNHGYMPNEEDLSLINVGVDNRETVAAALGTPSAGGVISGGDFYYARSQWKTVGARAPREVDRQVLAISFDEGGTVSNIERFTLEDGRVVTLSRRITDTSIRNLSFIRQLLGNIGRLSADQLLQ